MSEVTVEQAASDLNRVMLDLAATYPDTNKGNGSKIIPLKERVVDEFYDPLRKLARMLRPAPKAPQ